jgi:hypothetical protein
VAYKIQFAGPNEKVTTETFERAVDALALASELLARLPTPLVYILDQEERELTLDDLEKLAKDESL